MGIDKGLKRFFDANKQELHCCLRNFYFWAEKCPYSPSESEEFARWILSYARERPVIPSRAMRGAQQSRAIALATSHVREMGKVGDLPGERFILGRLLIKVCTTTGLMSRPTVYKRAKRLGVDFTSLDWVKWEEAKKILELNDGEP